MYDVYPYEQLIDDVVVLVDLKMMMDLEEIDYIVDRDSMHIH
jgi:hypothetical protein